MLLLLRADRSSINPIAYHERSSEPIYSSKEIQQTYLFFDNNQPAIDIYVVSQRGENILCELLAALHNNQSLKSIPNTALYENGSVRFTQTC